MKQRPKRCIYITTNNVFIFWLGERLASEAVDLWWDSVLLGKLEALLPMSCPKPEYRLGIFPNGVSTRCMQCQTTEVCASQQFEQRHWAKMVISFHSSETTGKNGWLSSISWEWMESTGLLGNLQQDFSETALGSHFPPLISLTLNHLLSLVFT